MAMIHYKTVFGNMLGTYDQILPVLMTTYRLKTLPSSVPEEIVEFFNTLIDPNVFMDYHNGNLHVNLINDPEFDDWSEEDLFETFREVIDTDYKRFLDRLGMSPRKPIRYRNRYEK